MKSKRPNRFFGVNPQGISNQGKREEPFSHELPKDWRSALGLEADAASAPEVAEDPAQAADAEPEGAAA